MTNKEDGDVLLNLKQTCEFFGGPASPIDRATLYRWIGKGIAPKPIRIGPRLSRWRRWECQAALDAMMAEGERT